MLTIGLWEEVQNTNIIITTQIWGTIEGTKTKVKLKTNNPITQ